MFRTLLAAAILCCTMHASGYDIKYPVSSIPLEMLKNANAVKRMDETRFVINNTRSTTTQSHFAITILNSKAEDQAVLTESYDKLHKINKIEGNLYDAEGNLLKKLKSKDVKDVSAVSDMNFMEDSRIKTFSFFHNTYPYTIEYFIEESANQTFNFPVWMPVESEDFSVEQSTFVIEAPADFSIRHFSFNHKDKPVINTTKGRTIYTWELKMQKPLQVSFAAPSWREISPVVYFAPGDFELQGYKGNMNSWENFGRFIQSLNEGRNVLPAQVKLKVKELIAGKANDRDKIKTLYEYMQKNTRYLSIQLGVGGWQPFDATYVSTKNYGDCKALTNFMQSLLSEANIPSSYVLIYAGEGSYAKNRLITEFPANQFNHALLCVPLGKDSMWLECTSQTLPAGYVSGFTANRKALMITSTGGKIVNTPVYGIRENRQVRKAKATLNTENELQIHSKTVYYNEQQDDLSQMVTQLSRAQVEKLLQNRYSLSTYRINTFKFDLQPGQNPEVEENLDITALHFANQTGKRIFIKPNIMNRQQTNIDFDSSRTAVFLFHYAFADTDDIEISVPEGYDVESMPKDTEITSSFGTYSIKTSFKNNILYYHRYYERKAIRVPADEQKEVISFLREVSRLDSREVVLVKK